MSGGGIESRALKMSKTRKPHQPKIKVRNWRAVDAHFRSSAGNMGDNRKKESRTACRDWKHNKRNLHND